jgi:hypothetical protein
MKLIEARDVCTDDPDDDKYWRFVGQDWIWLSVSREDLRKARQIQDQRTRFAKQHGFKTSQNGSLKDRDFHGALGEMALSYLLQAPINSEGIYQGQALADVGGVEAKSTSYGSSWRLYINANQLKSDRPYVLCKTFLAEQGYLAILGWIYGFEVRAQKQIEVPRFRSQGEAYFVGWHSLRLMEQLVSERAGQGQKVAL